MAGHALEEHLAGSFAPDGAVVLSSGRKPRDRFKTDVSGYQEELMGLFDERLLSEYCKWGAGKNRPVPPTARESLLIVFTRSRSSSCLATQSFTSTGHLVETHASHRRPQ
jgi:hypothetical protein